MNFDDVSVAGILVVVYGPGGEGAHAAVEYADLQSVFDCAKTIAAFVEKWSG